jgi:hypothetical protein
MKKVVAATLLAFGAMSGAQAQYYGELAYLSTTVKASEAEFKAKLNAVRATLGYEVNPNIAVEGMFATGFYSGGFKYEPQHVLTKHETLRRGF